MTHKYDEITGIIMIIQQSDLMEVKKRKESFFSIFIDINNV